MYNPYLKTSSALARGKAKGKTETVESTAGSAKTPRVAVNNEDLRAQAEANGWTAPRPLTMTEIKAMSSSEIRFHEVYNKEELDKALGRAANKVASDENIKSWEGRKFWTKYWNTTTAAPPEEAAKIKADMDRFVRAFPQFLPNRKENAVVLEWLKNSDLPLTFDNLAESFRVNVLEGKVIVDPSAIGIGTETEVTGEALANHPKLRILLEEGSKPLPQNESAKEFYKAHSELHRGKPYLIKAREGQEQSTQKSFEKARQSTARSNVVNVTDYPKEPRGVPPLSEIEKASLRTKVKNMSARELAEKCANDPSFRAALDALEARTSNN